MLSLGGGCVFVMYALSTIPIYMEFFCKKDVLGISETQQMQSMRRGIDAIKLSRAGICVTCA